MTEKLKTMNEIQPGRCHVTQVYKFKLITKSAKMAPTGQGFKAL